MKVLMINGSPNEQGCTYTALNEIAVVLQAENIETEILYLGKDSIKDCVGCGVCKKIRKCVFNEDKVNEVIEKAKYADGFVFGTPVYFAHPSGRILSFLDRLFYAGKQNFEYKPAAAIASARRAGTTASIDVLNKYFTISNMPVVSSNYWNMVHGNTPEEVQKDLEGLQIMRILAYNLVWLLKCIEIAKSQGVLPKTEEKIRTNFIR